MYYDDTLGNSGLTAWDACIASQPGGVDLYGDCDYLIPMYPSPVMQATGTGSGTRPPVTPPTDWDKMLKDYGVYLLGGAAVLLLLMRRK